MTDEEEIADVIVAGIRAATKPLVARLAALETKPDVSYEGVFVAEKSYPAGALTTRNGGLWLATCATMGLAPGNGQAVWKLVVKSGGA